MNIYSQVPAVFEPKTVSFLKYSLLRNRNERDNAS